jgi:hypothetical protein
MQPRAVIRLRLDSTSVAGQLVYVAMSQSHSVHGSTTGACRVLPT